MVVHFLAKSGITQEMKIPKEKGWNEKIKIEDND
jgi:hypothetical protein